MGKDEGDDGESVEEGGKSGPSVSWERIGGGSGGGRPGIDVSIPPHRHCEIARRGVDGRL